MTKRIHTVFILMLALSFIGAIATTTPAFASIYEDEFLSATTQHKNSISHLNEIRQEITSLNNEISSVKSQIDSIESQRKQALVSLYKMNNTPSLVFEMFLDSQSLKEALSTIEALQSILDCLGTSAAEAMEKLREFERENLRLDVELEKAKQNVNETRLYVDTVTYLKAAHEMPSTTSYIRENSDLARLFCSLAYSKHVSKADGYPRTRTYALAYDSIWLPKGDLKYRAGKVEGRSCDRGVATAVLLSGFDDDFPRYCGNANDGQWKHMMTSSRWENLGLWSGDENDLEPGDILIRIKGVSPNAKKSHVCMYIGHDIIMDVYENVLKGTDADVGVPDSKAAWVSSSFADGTERGRAPCMGKDGDKSMTVFRCSTPERSSSYSHVLEQCAQIGKKV